MKYQIELNENQLRVMQLALEEYFRLRLGQDWDFSNDLAFMGSDLDADNPMHDQIFQSCLLTRDHIREMMRAVFHIAFGSYGTPNSKTEDMLIAEDLWDSIRFARGLSRWNSPLIVSNEPAPIIKKLDEEKRNSKVKKGGKHGSDNA